MEVIQCPTLSSESFDIRAIVQAASNSFVRDTKSTRIVFVETKGDEYRGIQMIVQILQ